MAALVLRGGHIVDGLESPQYLGDLYINSGRIARILNPGESAPNPGLTGEAEELDVTGLVISPGFIDMHAHSDLAVLADSDHLAKVAQGVTLEVVGQDGLGYAPVTDEVMATMRAQIEGWNGNPLLDYAWRSIADYLKEVDLGAPVNVAVLVPHGTARMTVMGTESRRANDEELEQIRNIIAQGLHDGAMGMSAGLTYPPGMYASDEEIAHSLVAVREIGGYYCPHHRNYGSRVVEGYKECIDLAKRAEVPLHLAHCHINFPQNRGRAHEVLSEIDAAVGEGIEITLDSYPYLSGATYLAALLPSWVHEYGAASTIRLLANPESRLRIIRELELDGSDGNHGIPIHWETITISSTKETSTRWAIGKSIEALAAERRITPGDLFADLLVADSLGSGCLVAAGNEGNLQLVLQHKAHTVGTDGILVGERPHPRGWGTFPRFIGHYARDLGLMSLEAAVSHATGRPARTLRLVDRGVIAEGFWADLVVFDANTIASHASYENPTLGPMGIHHVFVNGEQTLRYGQRTSALPGRAIRRA